MSGAQKPARALLDRREEAVDNDEIEPIHTREREVQENHSSVFHNVPNEAKDLLGLDGDSTVRIQIFRDFYIVDKVEEE